MILFSCLRFIIQFLETVSQNRFIKNRDGLDGVNIEMVKVLQFSDLDVKVQEFLNALNVSNDDYLVESNGKPLVGLVSSNEIKRKKRFEVFDRDWERNQNVNDDEVERDIADAVSEVRANHS